MAIDTEAKRLGVIHTGAPWRTSFPIPDGTIAAADRAVVAKMYTTFTTVFVANSCRTITPFAGETVTVRC